MTSAGSEGKPEENRAEAAALVSILFLLNLLEEFLLRLTLHAQFREGHGFQSLFADFDAAFRANTVGAFAESG